MIGRQHTEREAASPLALGIAAPEASPLVPRALAAAAREVERLGGGHGYFPLGLPALRRAVHGRLEEGGLPTEEDQVLITSGAQQALALAAGLFVRPGDTAL